MMVASAVGLVVLAAILSTVVTLAKTMKVSIDEADSMLTNQMARRAMETELRGLTSVIAASDTQFHFRTTNKMGESAEIYYLISQQGSSWEFRRNEVSDDNTEKVIYSTFDDGLSNVEFTYYNQLGQELSEIPVGSGDYNTTDTNAIQVDIERSIAGVQNTLSHDLQITMIMFRNKVYDL